MSFKQALESHFPGAVLQSDFVTKTYHRLSNNYGFNNDNSIACVSVCRDELTAPLVHDIHVAWGEAFNFSSLAGLPTLGKTGFSAARHHAPIVDGSERYIFFGLPHIAIGPQGEIGLYERSGRPGDSTACGALNAFHKEMLSGHLHLEFDTLDIEQSLLKQRLFSKIRYGDLPDLVSLTKLAHTIIVDELEKLITAGLQSSNSKYAVLTGIQIHNLQESDYIWPGKMYTMIDGERQEITLLD